MTREIFDLLRHYLLYLRNDPVNLFVLGPLWVLVTLLIGLNRSYRYFGAFFPLWSREMELYRDFFEIDHGTVVDVGANIGVYTLVSLRHAKKVISVEPNPRVLWRLRLTCRPFKNAVIVNMALSDSSGKIYLFDHGTTLGASITRKSPKKERISATTLDKLITALHVEDLTLVKIDTEGAEHLVLKGGGKALMQQRPMLMIEYHDNKEKVSNLCKTYGYRWQILREENRSHFPHEHGWIIAIPRSDYIRLTSTRIFPSSTLGSNTTSPKLHDL